MASPCWLRARARYNRRTLRGYSGCHPEEQVPLRSMSDTTPLPHRLHTTATMRAMRLALTLLAALACGLPARAHATPRRPVAAISHVLILSVDGLRPDLVLRANTPTLHSLLTRGSFTMWA